VSRSIELPDRLYQDLEREAQERGLSVADWIAAHVACASSTAGGPLLNLFDGLLGAVDSTREPRNSTARTPFSDMMARKFEKQGLRRPLALSPMQARSSHLSTRARETFIDGAGHMVEASWSEGTALECGSLLPLSSASLLAARLASTLQPNFRVEYAGTGSRLSR
jgi:hypothetical protein